MTKTPQLPVTDLAETCTQPEELQWTYLRRLARARPKGSYLPTRKFSSDIMNVQDPMFGEGPATPWSKIEPLVRGECWNEYILQANLAAARAIHNHVLRHRITGRLMSDVLPFQLGIMGFVTRFWEPTALVEDGELSLVFLDLRRKFGLTSAGRNIVHSVMNEHIRKTYQPYGKAHMRVFQLTDTEEREVVVFDSRAEALPLLSYDELQQRIDLTYSIWMKVLAERAEYDRAQDDGGPLFGGKSA